MEETNNNTSLKDLFTSDKFTFIERLDSDIESSKNLLEESQKNKDLIDSLIYSLSSYVHIEDDNNYKGKRDDLIAYTNSISELVDYNIRILKTTTDISNSIKQHIVDMLVKTDENNSNQYDYSTEIDSFKNKIEEYSVMLENSNPVISNNNKKIFDFFNNPDIKKYLKEFSIVTNNTSELVSTTSSQDNSSEIAFSEKKDKEILDETYKENSKKFTTIEENNNVLLVSEKEKKVYLPYSKEEVLEYLKQYPNKYSSFNDVVRNEFIFPSDIYLKHTLASRFRETYSLMRDREAKSIFESFKYAVDIMFHYDLNPTIIAACKTQEQLQNYLKCLENNNLSNFNDFEIRFEVNPLSI